MRNLYPLRYQEAVHAATAAARGEGECIAWSRSGWAGAQRAAGRGLPFARPLVLEFPDAPAGVELRR